MTPAEITNALVKMSRELDNIRLDARGVAQDIEDLNDKLGALVEQLLIRRKEVAK